MNAIPLMPVRRTARRGLVRAGTILSAIVAVCHPLTAQSWKFQADNGGQVVLRTQVNFISEGDAADSDSFVTVSPRFTVSNDARRLKVRASYAPSLFIYPLELDETRTRNTLSATANLEAMEDHLFVDADANVSQQFLTPFGPLVVDEGTETSNRAETRTLGVSPYLRGVLVGDWLYELRHRSYWSSTDASGVQSTYTKSWRATLDKRYGALGWNFLYSRNESETGSQAGLITELWRATLNYRIDPEFSVFGRGGYETNNFLIGNRNNITYGAGFNWTPTSRTQISGSWDDRYFGSGYQLSVRHRMRRSSVSVAGGRDVSTSPQQLFSVSASDTATLLDAIFSSDPDYLALTPEERRQFIEAFMTVTGLPSMLLDVRNLYSNLVTRSEFISAAFAISGVRRTLAVSVFWRDTETLVDTFGAALPNALLLNRDVTQTGASVTYSYKLSPATSLSVTGSHIVAKSNSGSSNAESTNNLIVANLTKRITQRTNGSVGVRYSHFDSNVSRDTTEGAVIGSLVHTF